MPPRLSDSRLANIAAEAILSGYATYAATFRAITRRAHQRFLSQDWQGRRADVTERLDLYALVVGGVVEKVRDLLADRVEEKLVWAGMKAVYSGLILRRDDWELAETFFNSITRRVFSTIGVDPHIEFVDTDFETPPTDPVRSPYRSYPRPEHTADLAVRVLADLGFAGEFADLARDVSRVTERIDETLLRVAGVHRIQWLQVLDSAFYRGKAAYIIGRLAAGGRVFPLVIALRHPEGGIVADAVLMTENDVSILFSFTRSHFHVCFERSYDMISFLRSLMPRKRVAELYIGVGCDKHGKTELYRDLMRHLGTTDERFDTASGAAGMVMEVFTMPSYDVVFKVIKDRFAPPKQTTRELVMEKYRMVSKHERAGRLVEAQEFEHLELERRRFSPELLARLLQTASHAVSVEAEKVVIHHAYLERQVTPLDVYIRDASDPAAAAAVIDYGHAIKELTVSNIFPGDMLLKNFGVTRHGRVVFYDYDELSRMTECRFRRLPPARSPEEDLAPGVWFGAGQNDVFPEEFPRFLGLPPHLRKIFDEHHGDLFTPRFWRDVQERVRAGEYIEIYPYEAERRLGNPGPKVFG